MTNNIENFEPVETIDNLNEEIQFEDSQIDCITREMSSISDCESSAMIAEACDEAIKAFYPKLDHKINFTSFKGRNSTLDSILEKMESKYMEAPSDMEQIEQISTYMASVKELRFENWSKLSVDQMIEIFNQLDKEIAIIEHRNPQTISAKKYDDPNIFGEHQGNCIRINSNLLEKSAMNPDILYKTLETFIHEGRHAYQVYNVEVRRVHQSQAEVDTWKENLVPYSSSNRLGYYEGEPVKIPLIGSLAYTNEDLSSIGERLYHYQPVEIDARVFASDWLKCYLSKISGTWYPYDDLYWMKIMTQYATSPHETNFWVERMNLIKN